MNKTITTQELIDILKDINKGTFCNVILETDYKMLKKQNPFYDKQTKQFTSKITKQIKGNYLLGNSYQQRVNNNMSKENLETNFISGSLKGKKHVSKVLLTDTKTESIYYLMLEHFVEKPLKIDILLDGNIVKDQETLSILNAFKAEYHSQISTQEQEKKVTVLTPKVSNIKEITLNSTHYKIIN